MSGRRFVAHRRDSHGSHGAHSAPVAGPLPATGRLSPRMAAPGHGRGFHMDARHSCGAHALDGVTKSFERKKLLYLCEKVEFMERILLPADGVDKQIFRAPINAAHLDGHGVRIFATRNVHPQPTG
jgi:hypothetical protein